MTSSELARLRDSLRELQSYELPANYRRRADVNDVDKENGRPNNNNNDDGNNNDDEDGIAKRGDANNNNNNNDKEEEVYNPQLLQRYKTARDQYIQQRTIEQFLASLQNYNAASNTLPLPNDSADSSATAIANEEDDQSALLAARQQEVLTSVKQTMALATGGMDEVQTKWNRFVEKREELCRIVEGMERSERNRRLEETDDNENDNDNDGGNGNDNEELQEEEEEEITEDDVALQEEKLDELSRRKLALENRLRSVRAQALDVEDDCHRTKRAVNEVRARGGRKPLDWRGMEGGKHADGGTEENGDGGNEGTEENGDYATISAVADGVDVEIAEMKEKAADMRESSGFYDGVKELLEELGGIKILSSKSIPASSESSSGGANDGEESPEKRQKLQQQEEEEEEEEGFVLTLMLLNCHILEITLAKSSANKDGLVVSNAKLTTPTAYPVPESNNTTAQMDMELTANLMETMHSVSLTNESFSKIMSQKQSGEVSIPPLDDLVKWSEELKSSSSQGIRFVLVETLARLRTAEARVHELARLRERYAAQVYDVERSSSENGDGWYGGAEQEVVCAMSEGITLALKLGADCPLVPGSVYVSEIFGVGGWDESKLEELKGAVLERRCRGPVEVMEFIVKEVRRRSEDEGWVVPGTPCLPR